MKLAYTKHMSELRQHTCPLIGSQVAPPSSFSQVMALALERRLAMARALQVHEPQPLCDAPQRDPSGTKASTLLTDGSPRPGTPLAADGRDHGLGAGRAESR